MLRRDISRLANPWIGIAVLALLIGAGPNPPTPVEDGITVLTLDKAVSGQALLFDKKETLRLMDAQNKPMSIPLKTMIEARYARTAAAAGEPAPGSVTVYLTNGDHVKGVVGKAGRDAVTLTATAAGQIKIPFEFISMILFTHKGFQKSKTRPAETKADVIRLISGDEDVGRIVSLGTEGVVFKSNKAPETTFDIKAVYEVYFEALGSPPADPAGTAAVDVLLNDGSRVRGTLQESDARSIKMQSVYAALGPLTVPADRLDTLHFNNPAVVYLSDMNPAKVNEHPFVESEGAHVFRVQRDRSVYAPDQPIRILKQTYRKGLGVHAYSLLAYPLNGQYTRFTATAGLDDTSEGLGSVVFRVYGDNKKLFESSRVVGSRLKTQRGDVTGPQAVDVDVTAVKELMLVVDFGDDDDVRDRAAWGNARIIKK